MDKLKPYLNAAGNKNWTVTIEEGENTYSTLKGLLNNNRDKSELTTSAYINWNIFSGDCFAKPGIWTTVHNYNIPLEQPQDCFIEDCFNLDSCFTNDSSIKYFYNPVTQTYTPYTVGDNSSIQIPLLPISINPFTAVNPYLTSITIDSEYIAPTGLVYELYTLLNDLHLVARVYKPVLKVFDNQVGIKIYKRIINEDSCIDYCIFTDLKLVKDVVINLDDINNPHIYCDNSIDFLPEEGLLTDKAIEIHLARFVNKQTESYLLGIDINNNPYYYNGEISGSVSYSNTYEVKEIIIRGKLIKYIQIDNQIYIWQEGNVYENSYVLTVDVGISTGLGEQISWVETNIPVDYTGRFNTTKRIPLGIRVFKFHYIFRDNKQLAGLFYSKGNNLLKNNTLLYRDLTLIDQASNLEELCFSLLLLLNTNIKGKPNEYIRAYHQHPSIKQLIEQHIELIHSYLGPDNSIPKEINAFINPTNVYNDNKFKKLLGSCLDTSILERGECNIFDDDYIVNDSFICSKGCNPNAREILLNTREVSNAALCYYWLLLINYERVYKSDTYRSYGLDIKSYMDNNISRQFFLINDGWNSSDIWTQRERIDFYSYKTNVLLFICYMQWGDIVVDPYSIKTADRIYNSLQDNYYLLGELRYKHKSLDQVTYGLLLSSIENRQEQLDSYKSYIQQNLVYSSSLGRFILHDSVNVYTLEDNTLIVYETEDTNNINKVLEFNSSELNPINKTILNNLSITDTLNSLLQQFNYYSLIEDISKLREPTLDFFNINNWSTLYKYQISREENLLDLKHNTPIGELYFSKDALERGEIGKLYKGLSSEISLDSIKEDYINLNSSISIKERSEIFNIESFHNEDIYDFNLRTIKLYSNDGINKEALVRFIKDSGLDRVDIKETQILGVHTDNLLFNPYLPESYLEGDTKYLGHYQIDVYEGPLDLPLFEDIREKLPITRIPIINEFITTRDTEEGETTKLIGFENRSIYVPVDIEPVCCPLSESYTRCNNGVLYRIKYIEPVVNVYGIYQASDGTLVGLYNPLPNYVPIQVIMPINNSIQYIYLRV